MPRVETYEELLDELIGAIELRECGDPDGRDWTVEARIRRLERSLLTHYRVRPSRTDAAATRTASADSAAVGATPAR